MSSILPKRLTQLSAALDDRLKQFQSIDTAEESYSYCGYADGDRKPSFPSLYLSRSKDKGLMGMPGEGEATVRYKVRSRSVDESRGDGVPLYGANIEIRSIEPNKPKSTALSATLFLKQFGERSRDGAGRYAAGNVPTAEDFGIVEATKKKKVAAAAGIGAGVLGGALGGTAKGRAAAAGIGRGVARAAGRLLVR